MIGTTAAARGWLWAAAVAIGVLGLSGCSKSKPPKTAAESRPISSAEALEFGESLADAFMNLDAQRLNEAVDAIALMEIASEGVSAPWNFRSSFLKGVKKSQERNGNFLLRELKPEIEAGTTFVATRGTTWEGKPAVILRKNGVDGGVGYLVFLLDRRPDGRIRSTDYYSLVTGELASQAANRLYLSAVADAKLGFIDRLIGKKAPVGEHLEDLKRMSAANREGRPQDAIAVYDGLPEEVKAEKTFALLRFHAAQRLDDQAKYLDAMNDFARRFPGDPACDFLLIDAYVLQGRHEKALENLDRLEKPLGDDAYLSYLRGNILTLLKRPEDALKAYRAALAREPDLAVAYDNLLGTVLKLKRFAEVAELLDDLYSRFDPESIGDLSAFEGYSEFLASPEGEAWKSEHDAKMTTEDEPPTP